MGADLRELALGQVRVELVNAVSEHELQDGVAEEFESLIVMVGLAPALVRDRRMGEGLHEQIEILELVADSLLQLLRMHDRRVAFACRGMLPPRRSSGRKIQLLRGKSTKRLPRNRALILGNFSGVPNG